MRFTYKLLVVFFVAALAFAFGQGPQPGQGPSDGQGFAQGKAKQNGAADCDPQLIMASPLATVTGTVEELFNAGFDEEEPSMKISTLDKLIKLAPVWFFLENDIEIDKGDTVKVTYAASAISGDLYAIRIELLDEGASIDLRNPETGQPLWVGGYAYNRNARGRNGAGYQGEGARTGNCLDLASAVTVTGTINAILRPEGIRQTKIAFTPDGGQQILVRMGPVRLLMQQGLMIQEGARLTLTVAKDACSDELVVTAAGPEGAEPITLRNAVGAPTWAGRGQGGGR